MGTRRSAPGAFTMGESLDGESDPCYPQVSHERNSEQSTPEQVSRSEGSRRRSEKRGLVGGPARTAWRRGSEALEVE